METLKWLSLGNMCADEIFSRLEPREKSPEIKFCMYVCVKKNEKKKVARDQILVILHTHTHARTHTHTHTL